MRAALVSAYRVRGILYYAAVVTFVVGVLGPIISQGVLPEAAGDFLIALAVTAAVVSLVLTVVGPRLLPERVTRVVVSPVLGRWRGLNSPATKVPSHGVRMYGQAHAIDLVHEPEEGARPVFGGDEPFRQSSEYPAFGQPVLAMTDGVVVAVSDWRRDHRARSTTAGFLYMMAEGVVREAAGPGFIIGNHVVVRGDDGVFALVAHLQRASAAVRVGDRVRAGQAVARCGNSGNSSEPHVHAQLMDRRSPLIAQGVPMAFASVELEGSEERRDAMPENDQIMIARADRA